jgi:hypothetical protein
MISLKSSMKPLLGVTGSLLTTLLVAAPSLSATLSLTTTRADFGSNDVLDWAKLGSVVPPIPFKVLPFSFVATSADGLNVDVNIPPPSQPGITPPLLFQTTATGIPTNFAAGDFVLFTGLLPGQFPGPGNSGPLTLTFETPVTGAGTQIAVDDTLQFVASVSAFDAQNKLLGSFSAPGSSSLALDNSALFLGVLSDTANISRLEFSTSVPNRAIGINALSIRTTAVPEPGSVAALLLTGIGLGVTKRKRVLKRTI